MFCCFAFIDCFVDFVGLTWWVCLLVVCLVCSFDTWVCVLWFVGVCVLFAGVS